jgi:hypothetical protein
MRKRLFRWFFLFLSLCSLLLSCRTTFDFRNEKNAATQIAEDIQTKKIIFIEENHTDVFPIYFLARNLERFYQAGVRYIFLEDQSDKYIYDPGNFNFFLFPPWMSQGNKFEYLTLEDEIKRINAIHQDDQLLAVWPETGLVLTKEDTADTNRTMNKRDRWAQNVIITTMDTTDKKAIIFYGGAHGLKKPTVWDRNSKEAYWKTMGCYLDEHYGSDFTTFSFCPYGANTKRNVLYTTENDCKIIPEKTIYDLLKRDGKKPEFDYYCLYRHAFQGVQCCFVPEKSNLKYMISLLADSKISPDREIDVWSKKSEQLLSIYYLKYHLGNKFDFDWNMSEEKLYQALDKITGEDLQNHSYDLTGLENYTSWLYSWQEAYLTNYPESFTHIDEDLPYYVSDMTNALKLNPHDIWSQYWIAYFQTDKAVYSNKEKDYKIALASWEKLLQNDLVYASPVLKLVYQKITLCAEKSGDTEKARLYQDRADNVNPLIDIDFNKYVYFGK